MLLLKNQERFSVKDVGRTLFVLLITMGMLLSSAPFTVQAQGEGNVEYTIRAGDTLINIAQSFDTTIEILLAANPDINDPSLIFAGTKLLIPSGDLPPHMAVIGPTNGTPGSSIELRGEGYQPNREFQILFGPENSDPVSVQNVIANASGQIYAELTIPTEAIPGTIWAASIQPIDHPGEYSEKSNTFLVEAKQDQLLAEDETIVYLVDLEDQGIHGELIGCGDSLMPVALPLDPNTDPIEGTFQNLFEIGERYGNSRFYNSLYQSDLTVDHIEFDGKAANLYLNGTKQLGGVCDEPRFEAQIIETANQFPEVSDVTVFINGERVFAEENDPKGSDNQNYIVQPNDVLSHIAVSFRTNVAALTRFNAEIQKPSEIFVGQEIYIPDTDDDNPYLQIMPTNGVPGTTVEYRAENLLPHRNYRVGIGQINSEYEHLMEIVTDETGAAEGQVTIPRYAEINRYYVVVLNSMANPDLKVVSNLFEVE